MKFDKETIIVFTICIVILLGWEPFCRKVGWLPERTEVKTVQKNDKQNNAVEKNTAAAEQKTEKAPVKKEIIKLPLLKLENNVSKIIFNDSYSSIDKIIFKDFLNNKKDGKITVDTNYELDKGMLSVTMPKNEILSNKVTSFKKSGNNRVSIENEITFKDKSVVTMNRVYELDDKYTVNFNVSFKSNKDILIPLLEIGGGDLQTWSALSGDKIRSDRLEITTFDRNEDDETLECDVSDSKFFISPALVCRWEALSNKFFTLILKGGDNFTPTANRLKLEGKKQYLASIAAQYSNIKLDKNISKTYTFNYYAGPKEPVLLKKFDNDTGVLVHLAWGPLNGLAKGLLWSLIQLKNICGSYGWSIIILTIIVRLIFWPITKKSNESMKKMQQLQPQIKELREKYKDNPQLLNTKTMELYQKEQVNPFGGCLPILLQIPVFFALYATLDNALELRQVSFWWSPDLATADTVWSYPLGFSVFGISNLKLNPLVIVMTILMVVQQRMTPSAMDPAQQKMMALMPVFMLIFLYDLPSGLTLYWTVSQIFSLLQVYLQRKFDKKKSAAA